MKQCFVIAPIGEPNTDVRRRSDQILKYVISPAVEVCGYTAIRADAMDKPGLITSQVIQRIVDDPLVIADLTGRNPNVYYELAIRHMLRRPFIQLLQRGESLPFDIAGTRTIFVDHCDLDSVHSAKTEITTQIRSLEQDPSRIETPISAAIDLQTLRDSEDPGRRSLADIIDAISEIRIGLSDLREQVRASSYTAGIDTASFPVWSKIMGPLIVDAPAAPTVITGGEHGGSISSPPVRQFTTKLFGESGRESQRPRSAEQGTPTLPDDKK